MGNHRGSKIFVLPYSGKFRGVQFSRTSAHPRKLDLTKISHYNIVFFVYTLLLKVQGAEINLRGDGQLIFSCALATPGHPI